jgi:membrane protease YdiL (CAAX protease family)
VFATTFGVIFLGLVVQDVLLAVSRAAHWEPAVAIRYALWADLAFYGAVAALVLRRAQSVTFRPIWTVGDSTEGLIRGVLIGAGVALGLVLLGRLATGQITGDPRIGAIISERTLPRIVGAILIACVCAPWVEELLFRGLALESLRPWGTKAAVFGSASLFALWHTDVVLAGWQFHLAPFLYYVAMGSAFGTLYLKRGLQASIGAHTAFNGMLIVVALTAMTGPSHLVSNGTVTATVPASWQLAPAGQAVGYDMAVSGPSGSGLLVMHRAMPPGAQLDPDTQAAEVSQRLGAVGITVDPTSTRTADFPMGHVLRMSAMSKGHAAEIVLVQRGGTLWQTVLVAAGSHRAEKDFEGILQHLQLP